MTTDRLPKLQFLDSLRGWAILLVLLVHSAGPAELFGSKLALANFGQRGVQLFYEISAFSLLHSFYARRERSWSHFFIRRFFRIAPLFYLSIAANFVWVVILLHQTALPLVTYASGFLFLFGFHPAAINAVAPAGWSIAVESSFYLLFPLLASRIRSLASALPFALAAMLACLVLCHSPGIHALALLPREYVQFLWFPAEFPIFALGFVAFFTWRDLLSPGTGAASFVRHLNRPRVRKATSLTLLGAAFLVAAASFPPSNFRLYPSSVCFVLLILGLSIHPWRPLVNPFTAFVGRLSYSIYLVHPYLADLVGSSLARLDRWTHMGLYGSYAGLAATFVLFLGGSLAISWFTHRWIELKGIDFGKRLVARRAGRSPAPPELSPEGMSPMNESLEIAKLQSRLRRCYAGWGLSLVALWGIAFLYRRYDPEKVSRPVAEYRAEIADYKAQLDAVAAEDLRNQRALSDAQAQLQRTNEDYSRATETLRKLQAASH